MPKSLNNIFDKTISIHYGALASHLRAAEEYYKIMAATFINGDKLYYASLAQSYAEDCFAWSLQLNNGLQCIKVANWPTGEQTRTNTPETFQ